MNKYDQKFKNDISLFANVLASYYGDEYKEIIIDKLENVNTIWYRNDDSDIISDIDSELLKAIKENMNSACFSQSCYINEFNVLVLPQDYEYTQLLHEINHMVSTYVLQKKPLIIINGLEVSYEKQNGYIFQENNGLNEVVNQLITKKLISILKLYIPSVSYQESWQDKMFPLIEPFFCKFEQEIKNCIWMGI